MRFACTPRIMGMLDASGFSYFLKGYSYKVAHKVRNAVSDWQEIPDKDGGLFGISSKVDLTNLREFCKTIPKLEVFGFRQRQEDGKLKNTYYTTNVPDYMSLSVDGTLTGMFCPIPL